ncbi:SpoIIE family protein phosphatase [Spirillospora sp. CA-142024]|uniref:SpoIIE family protein phosphatase n=1 Tax=Spirillospora sp. CA-142024 TaxID=3240036 RepID=UPI003D927D89
MLVLYTDGAIEARSPAGHFYPLAERVASFPATSPDSLLHHIHSDLLTHIGDQPADDTALLIIKRSPPITPNCRTSQPTPSTTSPLTRRDRTQTGQAPADPGPGRRKRARKMPDGAQWFPQRQNLPMPASIRTGPCRVTCQELSAGVEQVHEQRLRAVEGLAECSYREVGPVVQISTVGDLDRLLVCHIADHARRAVAVPFAAVVMEAKAGNDPEDLAHLSVSCAFALRHSRKAKAVQRGWQGKCVQVLGTTGRPSPCRRHPCAPPC